MRLTLECRAFRHRAIFLVSLGQFPKQANVICRGARLIACLDLMVRTGHLFGTRLAIKTISQSLVRLNASTGDWSYKNSLCFLERSATSRQISRQVKNLVGNPHDETGACIVSVHEHMSSRLTRLPSTIEGTQGEDYCPQRVQIPTKIVFKLQHRARTPLRTVWWQLRRMHGLKKSSFALKDPGGSDTQVTVRRTLTSFWAWTSRCISVLKSFQFEMETPRIRTWSRSLPPMWKRQRLPMSFCLFDWSGRSHDRLQMEILQEAPKGTSLQTHFVCPVQEVGSDLQCSVEAVHNGSIWAIFGDAFVVWLPLVLPVGRECTSCAATRVLHVPFGSKAAIRCFRTMSLPWIISSSFHVALCNVARGREDVGPALAWTWRTYFFERTFAWSRKPKINGHLTQVPFAQSLPGRNLVVRRRENRLSQIVMIPRVGA